MDIPSEAFSVYKSHFDTAVKYVGDLPKTVLELGPGDSLNSAIFFYFSGCQKTYLVDNGNYATQNMEVYRRFIDYLNENAVEIKAKSIEHLKKCNTVDELIKLTNSKYLTNGMDSLKKLPENSVDFIFSNNVLEHIHKDEFACEMAELFRINKRVASHTVDYKDHLQKSLHSLRFSEKTWESQLFKEAGFYTNRLRHYDVLETFKANGYEVSQDNATLFLSPNKVKLHKDFSGRNDLMIAESHIVLSKSH